MQPDWLATNSETGEAGRKWCVQAQDEKHYKGCLWVMIVAHFFAYLISSWYPFLNSNYHEIKQEGYDHTKQYKIFTITALCLFTGCALLAYWIETLIEFPENDFEACDKERRRSYSIILQWMWADILISFMSVATVYLDYFFGKR